jgi:hypothetical protein
MEINQIQFDTWYIVVDGRFKMETYQTQSDTWFIVVDEV